MSFISPIRNANADFLKILTEWDLRGNFDFEFSLNVTAIDGQVIIRGDSRSGGHRFKPYYGKGKGFAVPVVAFSFMYKLANQWKPILDNATIAFTTEKN